MEDGNVNDMSAIDQGVAVNTIKMQARGVDVYYGDTHAIKGVDVDIDDKTVTAFIGTSG